MRSCQECDSKRVAHVNGKTSDLCRIELSGKERDGYVPSDMAIGGGSSSG